MGMVSSLLQKLGLNEEPKLKSHHFIYPKDKVGNRTGQTICILQYDGRIFHGISSCSKEDQFSKKVGRDLSLQRAVGKAERYAAKKAKV